MTYAEAMARYGSDKPDLRFGMEIVDVTDVAGADGLPSLRRRGAARRRGARASGLRAAPSFSRKDVDDLAAEAAVFGAQGVLPVWVEEQGVRSPCRSS